MRQWADFDVDFVRRRYNRLAAIYPFFEWLFWLPGGIRAETAKWMGLAPGFRVLEVGCGTGRNFSYLVASIGPSGHLYGVDLSEEMLGRAKGLCSRNGWGNVTLLLSDATAYSLPETVDAVLFSLCYSTMPHHRLVLRHAWEHLREGGRVVILDSKLPSGIAGRILRPWIMFLGRATVLGNPDVQAWEELRELAGRSELQERLGGTYFMCRASKQPASVSFGLSAAARSGL
jgi:demethylmenaquinone methyltransferase/2-methoxy-6-polyprenyl-1,4-benzoquinol methylase